MSDELKPCPFCGNTHIEGPRAEYIERAIGYGYTVFNVGHANISSNGLKCISWVTAESKEEAIERWNRRATPSPSTAPTEQNQAKLLPARRFVNIKGFWDADYVEFAEGCKKGGGVLNGISHAKHYTRRQAESYVAEGAWREVAAPRSVEQSSTAGAAKGGETKANSSELNGAAPIADNERAALLAALKPFADAYAPQAQHDDPDESPKMREFLDRNTITPSVTVGDFRRAHAAFFAALASKPAAREAARQSIADDSVFQSLMAEVQREPELRLDAEDIALIAHIDTWRVPAGFKMVPVEPTEAMIHAAEDVPAPRPFGKVYRAMIGAAPAAGNTAQSKEN